MTAQEIAEFFPDIGEPGPNYRDVISYVYFIHAPEVGMLKIGMGQHPFARLADFQLASPVVLEMLATVKGHRAEELRLHRKFAHLRVHGEWFRFAPELREFLDQILALGNSEKVA